MREHYREGERVECLDSPSSGAVDNGSRGGSGGEGIILPKDKVVLVVSNVSSNSSPDTLSAAVKQWLHAYEKGKNQSKHDYRLGFGQSDQDTENSEKTTEVLCWEGNATSKPTTTTTCICYVHMH